MIAAAFFALMPAAVSAAPLAVASSSNAIEQAFCNIILIMTGSTGKAVATVGIIGLGVGALFGKLSWNVAMLSVLSIGLIFGSASVVAELGGGTALSLIVGTEPDSGSDGGRGGSTGGNASDGNNTGQPHLGRGGSSSDSSDTDTCQAGSLVSE